jgi:hypothetical protein
MQMMDRRYTGTQRLQLVWSILCVLVAVLTIALGSVAEIVLPMALIVGVAGVGWLVGLVLLGVRERRQWNQMVDESSFSEQLGPHEADIETIIDGRSVTASTTVPSPLAQSHTELQAAITGVNASFTVTMEYIEAGTADGGKKTGHDALDSTFKINGSEENVARILSPDVKRALTEIETPGVCTITGEAVVFRVPFTALTPGELQTISQLLVTIATRVEAVGQTDS